MCLHIIHDAFIQQQTYNEEISGPIEILELAILARHRPRARYSSTQTRIRVVNIMAAHEVQIGAVHRLSIGELSGQLEEPSPDDRGLRGACQATPVHGSPEVRADAAGDEAILVHESNKAVRRSPGTIEKICTFRDHADADQTLHCVRNSV